MTVRKKKFSADVPTSVILPIPLQKAIVKRAVEEERSFSAIVRIALMKELGLTNEPKAEPQNPTKEAA